MLSFKDTRRVYWYVLLRPATSHEVATAFGLDIVQVGRTFQELEREGHVLSAQVGGLVLWQGLEKGKQKFAEVEEAKS